MKQCPGGSNPLETRVRFQTCQRRHARTSIASRKSPTCRSRTCRSAPRGIRSSASREGRMRYSLGVVFLSTILAAPQFDAVQPELFAAGNTLANAWADFDNDGDLDLFVGINGAPNRLYQNDGGTFRDVAVDVGVADARATRAAA